MSRATVSVIVPTLGRPDLAMTLARRLAELEPAPTEVVLVFQEPAERASALSRSTAWPDDAVSLRLELIDERSVTAARNHGGRVASGDILLFIDDDCSPESVNWARELCGPLVEEPLCMAVTGPVLDWQAASRGIRLGSNAVPVIPLLCHPVGRPDSRSGTRASSVWGGNFAVRRQQFLGVGGFRQDVFASPCIYEETELSLRLASELTGYIAYAPDAAVTHAQANYGGQRAVSSGFDAAFLGQQKGKLLDCVYGDGSWRAAVARGLNALVFGLRHLLARDVSSARGYVRGLWHTEVGS